jgi:branched-chain amino acid transport system substrate-binding protein
MFRVRPHGIVALIALAALSTSACGSSGGQDKESSAGIPKGPIVIGAAIAKTGWLNTFDAPALASLKLAVKEMNADGGVAGHQLKVVEADMKSDPAQAGPAAKRVLDEGAQMVLAPCDYDTGGAVARTASDAGVISFSTCSQSLKWGVQGIGQYTYTPGASALNEGYLMADFADGQGWKDTVVLVDTSLSYNNEVCQGYLDREKKLGGKVTKITFQNDDASISSQIDAIRASGADAIAFCSEPPGGASAVRQLRAASIDMPIVSMQGMDGEFWLDAVPNLSDFYWAAYTTISGEDPRPAVNEFLAKYEKEYGEQPLSQLALTGYANMQLWKSAVEEAKTTDAAAVAKVLNGYKDFPTVVGPVTFTKDVHITMGREMVFQKYVNGQAKFVSLLKPQDTPPFKLGD